MSHEETTKKKGRSQTKEAKRITNVCNSDRRDMRPIYEYLTPGKRKASGPATSPNSEAATKVKKTPSLYTHHLWGRLAGRWHHPMVDMLYPSNH